MSIGSICFEGRSARRPSGARSGGPDIGLALPQGLRLDMARSRSEFEQAFGLLHDAYVGAGFTRPDPSGLRVPFYQALANAVTFIALEGDAVVATIALIRRSRVGLPIEQIFDLRPFLAKPRFLAEISGLAIHPARRGEQRALLFGLLRYLHAYARRHMGVDDLFLTCNPRHIGFYERMLFRRLNAETVDSYDFVDGAPAVGAHIDLEAGPQRYFDAFEAADRPNNLYRVFFETDGTLPAEWPSRPAWLLSDNQWSDELVRYLFCERTRTVDRLTPRERRALGLSAADDPTSRSRAGRRAKVVLRGHLRSALRPEACAAPVAVHSLSQHYVDVAGIPLSLELGVAELAVCVDGIGSARAMVGPVTEHGGIKSLLVLDRDEGWRRLLATISERLPLLGWSEEPERSAIRSLEIVEAALAS